MGASPPWLHAPKISPLGGTLKSPCPTHPARGASHGTVQTTGCPEGFMPVPPAHHAPPLLVFLQQKSPPPCSAAHCGRGHFDPSTPPGPPPPLACQPSPHRRETPAAWAQGSPFCGVPATPLLGSQLSVGQWVCWGGGADPFPPPHVAPKSTQQGVLLAIGSPPQGSLWDW